MAIDVLLALPIIGNYASDHDAIMALTAYALDESNPDADRVRAIRRCDQFLDYVDPLGYEVESGVFARFREDHLG